MANEEMTAVFEDVLESNMQQEESSSEEEVLRNDIEDIIPSLTEEVQGEKFFFTPDETQDKKEETDVTETGFLSEIQREVEFQYTAHLEDYGWLEAVANGDIAGKPGQGKHLEAFCINSGNIDGIKIQYASRVQGEDWQTYVSDNELSGSIGKRKGIEAVRINISGNGTEKYNVYYSVYVHGIGWLDWACNGEAAGVYAGCSSYIEAIKVTIREKEDGAPGIVKKPYLEQGEAFEDTWLEYTACDNNGVWSYSKEKDGVCGSIEGSSFLEAIKIDLEQENYFNSVLSYRVHMQDYGWLNAVESGSVSGIPGEGRRVEALEINLTGDISNVYNIYYRAYVDEAGWLGWAANGETAGSVGISRAIKAYQIILRAKGEDAPDSNGKPSVIYELENKDSASADRLIEIALGEVGYKAAEGSETKYGRWYGENIGGTYHYTAPWCAMFISWCGEQAGISREVLYANSSTVNMKNWYEKRGQWRNKGDYIPLKGDMIFFKYPGNSNVVNHVGIVISSENGKVITVEGNYNNGVYTVIHDLNDGKIVGYGLPEYGDNGTVEEPDKFSVGYQACVIDSGWGMEVYDGSTCGNQDKDEKLEALKIQIYNQNAEGEIQYRTHIQYAGWTDWVSGGSISGMVSSGFQMEAIEIRLTGKLEELYDIYYRVYVQDYGWLDWAKNSLPAGTEGHSKQIKALEIKTVGKGEAAPGHIRNPYYGNVQIHYQTHVQYIGWQNYVDNGELSGTTGRSFRLEAFKVKLSNNTHLEGNVVYAAHVQDHGWQEWVTEQQVAGSEGEARRLEAVQIKLTEQLDELYDIYYRVHIQDYGWLDWAKNGEKAGSEGLSKRLEGLEIMLVYKGESAPGQTNRPYIK